MQRIVLYMFLAECLFAGNCYCLLSAPIGRHRNSITKLGERQKSSLNTAEQVSHDPTLSVNFGEQISFKQAQKNKTAKEVCTRRVQRGIQYTLSDCLNIFEERDKCHWLRKTQHCKSSTSGRIVSYMEIIFCYTDEKYMHISIIWMVLLLIPLISAVMLICAKFYVTAILATVIVLKLPENIAGITLLSFINGVADIDKSVQLVQIGKTDVQYNYIMGGSLIMIVFLVGVVCINTPFRVQGPQFLRDSLFTLVSVIYSFTLLMSGTITILQIIGFFLLYFIYLLLAVLQYIFHPESVTQRPKPHRRSTVISKLGASKHSEWLQTSQINSAITRGSVPVFPHRTIAYGEMEVTVKSMGYIQELCHKLNPIDGHQWNTAALSTKLCMILQAPIVFIFTLLIPVVDFSKLANGWIKSLNVLQIFITPLLCTFFHGSWNWEVLPGVQMYLFLALFSVVFGFFVIYTAPRFSPPAYHFMFAIIAMIASVIVMSVLISEIMAILKTIGTLLHITSATLGCTIMAWGISLADILSVVSLTQQGYYRMGFAMCYGSAIFNICIGFGIAFFVYYIHGEASVQSGVKVDAGVLGPNMVLCMVCGLISCVVMLPVMGFQARRSYGYFLLVLYTIFLLRTSMNELKLLHPLLSINKIACTFPNGTTVLEDPKYI